MCITICHIQEKMGRKMQPFSVSFGIAIDTALPEGGVVRVMTIVLLDLGLTRKQNSKLLPGTKSPRRQTPQQAHQDLKVAGRSLFANHQPSQNVALGSPREQQLGLHAITPRQLPIAILKTN